MTQAERSELNEAILLYYLELRSGKRKVTDLASGLVDYLEGTGYEIVKRGPAPTVARGDDSEDTE